MASKTQLTNRMEKLGMAWATRSDKHVSPDDPLGDQVRGRRTYHVHPDRSEPYSSAVKRFDTLQDLGEYITLRETYAQVVEYGIENYDEKWVLSLEDDLRQY